MGQSFSEHLAHAGERVTKELADVQDQSNLQPHAGQVFHYATRAAVQAGGELLTRGHNAFGEVAVTWSTS